ncbi:MAG: cytochrome d ubiquinol oxidase subunit II [Bacteroidales bacterium]|nr:cytochrome d ubiquinol oxidase subunit II [Bacteroidales bacterium]HOY39243.1 cytochrome d ubiquinol oxidase subunit II [Bacteroidales bacterium]HQP04218.1 cytochrome d ubiquinol oxidase subunit II [Bacteroidales bacterium]
MASITFAALQHYWWFLVSVLGSALVFLLFVQGGQMLIYTLGKNETERSMLVNSLGRKWEFTFTTLVTFGGAFFASFPLFYSTSFGGAYWVWLIILLAFTVQAVSYEFRSKPSNVFGKKTFETLLFINGFLGTILLGIVVATLYNGAEFSLNTMNHVKWDNPARGLEAALNYHNLLLGFSVFFLSRVLALLYFRKTIENNEICNRIKKQLIINAVPFVLLFVSFVTILLLKTGYAIDPETKSIVFEKYKYLHNLIQMPLVAIMFIAGVLAVLWGIIATVVSDKYDNGIWFTGLGTFFAVLALLLIAGLNNTSFYPSITHPESSLTVYNASSSEYTLKTMAIVSLIIPFVFAYIVVAWRSINKRKITRSEIEDSNEHHY